MRVNHLRFTVFVTVICWSLVLQSKQTECLESDLLIHNTTIYTANDDNWQAQAMAVRNGRVVFVGSNKGVKQWQCGAAKKLDLAGSFVFPGFTDSHQHLEGVGRRTRTLSLFGISSLAETVSRIEQWAKGVPDNGWVLGRGWIERDWQDEQRFLRAADVDPFTKSKPLFMPRADGVSALVNSKALALAGINADTPDPEGGKFERDKDGNPTGYILATAMDIFRALIPKDSDAYIKENLLRGMHANATLGWTQTHDAGMSWRQVQLLKELHQENKMAHRVYIAVPIKEADELRNHGAYRSADGLFELNGIKVFIDGTLGSRGAALLVPYADAKHRGFMNRTTKEELMPVLDMALANGFQVMTHVIGDRALNSVLDWYGEALAKKPKAQWQTEDLRWRLEHAQIIIPQDQQRLISMQVIPSMQPSHGIGDLNFAPARLGAERLANAYPWQPLVEQGVKIIGGSDAPVEVGDPRIEFYAAITRKRLDGTQGTNWFPEYAVSREDALRMFTIWAAYGAHQETSRGSLEVGKYADISVFDTDFMTAEPAKILSAKTVLTMVGGEVMYKAESLEGDIATK